MLVVVVRYGRTAQHHNGAHQQIQVVIINIKAAAEEVDASCLLLLPLQNHHKSTAAGKESDERQSKDVLGIKPITLL